MRKKRHWIAAGAVAALAAVIAAVWTSHFEYAYMPGANQTINRHFIETGYDLWGRFISDKAAGGGGNHRSPADGAVKIDEHLLKLGKTAFYKETFGNEVFLTDILGIINGPLTFGNLMKAVVALHGKGTTDLKVELASDAKIGGRMFRKGEKISTGIDVPKGAYAPLGIPVHYDGGKIRAGISCAACHATVDRMSKNVVEGAINNDLNLGLLMALAPNSASYFTHAQIQALKTFITEKSGTVTNGGGHKLRLPDPKKLEDAVDAQLLRWPAGSFDSTIDLKANPTKIPDAFTKGDFPYGWSGFAQVGPFHGLSVFTNNVHAQNTYPLSQADASRALFDIDKEVYIGTILQNAANPKFRYNPASGKTPSRFFAEIDPTPGVPGVNQLVKNPEFPKLTPAAPDGLIATSPGQKVKRENNAMAAWQNTIVPPKAPVTLDEKAVERGKGVFIKAGCLRCHAGAYLTNNRIVSAKTIGTDPSRARALKKTENQFGRALQYAPNTPTPLPKHPDVQHVPPAPLGFSQRQLGFAHGVSAGGYKTPSLNGLYWSAPYLHDGGVAVGKDLRHDLGIPGTTGRNLPIDPWNSLRALVDSRLRARVVAANRRAGLEALHVSGRGHDFYVDETTGFTKAEQDALIAYLLSLTK